MAGGLAGDNRTATGLGAWRCFDEPCQPAQSRSRQIRATESPGPQEARDALRLRYANGEISRDDYLQGKVGAGGLTQRHVRQ